MDHVDHKLLVQLAGDQLVAGMGTSTAAVLCHPDLRAVPGAFGIVDGGVVDGLWGYEVGQTSVGDTFAWFVANCVPQSYFDEAAEEFSLQVSRVLTPERVAPLSSVTAPVVPAVGSIVPMDDNGDPVWSGFVGRLQDGRRAVESLLQRVDRDIAKIEAAIAEKHATLIALRAPQDEESTAIDPAESL